MATGSITLSLSLLLLVGLRKGVYPVRRIRRSGIKVSVGGLLVGTKEEKEEEKNAGGRHAGLLANARRNGSILFISGPWRTVMMRRAECAYICEIP